MNIRRIIIVVVGFSAALLLSAGRIDWPAAWAFLFVFSTALSFLRVWVARHNPRLVKERYRRVPGVETWDAVLMKFYPGLLLCIFVVSGLDAGRFGWSLVPTGMRIFGWIGLGVAVAMVWWVLTVNPFASRLVRIQKNSEHEVVMAGPYRHVRHPMYVGVIAFVTCVPLILGSWWGLLPGAGAGFLFVLRTALEDRALLDRLPGYRDYASRVRYRLLPGVW